MTKAKLSQVASKDLYTAKDIADVRSVLIKEQNGLSALTGLPLSQSVLDHLHDTEQFVRAVINSRENVALGAIENLYVRHVKYWYNGSYSDFLRQVATFLEKPVDKRFRHNGWLSRVKILFNKLSESKKDQVLIKLNSTKGKNLSDRKKLFAKAILNRDLGYTAIMKVLTEA